MFNLDAFIYKFNDDNRSLGLEVTFVRTVKDKEPIALYVRYPRLLVAKAYENTADYAERYCSWQNFITYINNIGHGTVMLSSDRTAFERGIMNFDINPKDAAYTPDAIAGVMSAVSKVLKEGL